MRFPVWSWAWLISLALAQAATAQAGIANFDDLALPPESFENGPLPGADIVDGPNGPVAVGFFESGGVKFINRYDLTFDSAGGFAYSNQTDSTTPGFENQYSAFAGTGVGPGADNYGVSFGYLDQKANSIQDFDFDPSDVAQLAQLPYFELPVGQQIQSVRLTNTTYAALSMLTGDSFAKKFGGATGNDPDFLKLTAYATDVSGFPLPQSVDFYLADYRFGDNSLDYIVDTWELMDLSSLGGARKIYFNLSGSDIGAFGLNTPTYFAIDEIQFAPIPEPSTFILLALAGAGLLGMRRPRG